MSKPQAINFTETNTHTKRRTHRRTHTRPYVVRCGRPPKWRQHLRQCSRGNHKLCHSQRQRQRRQVKCLSYKFSPTPFLPLQLACFSLGQLKTSVAATATVAAAQNGFTKCAISAVLPVLDRLWDALAVQSKGKRRKSTTKEKQRKANTTGKTMEKHNEAYTDCVMINCTSLWGAIGSVMQLIDKQWKLFEERNEEETWGMRIRKSSSRV